MNRFTVNLMLFAPSIAPKEEVSPEIAQRLFDLHTKKDLSGDDLRPILESAEKNESAGNFVQCLLRYMIASLDGAPADEIDRLDALVTEALGTMMNDPFIAFEGSEDELLGVTIINEDGSVRELGQEAVREMAGLFQAKTARTLH